MAATLAQKGKRLSPKEYLDLCFQHFKVYWKRYTAPVVVLVIMQLFIRVDVNYTESLPDHVFITVKGWKSGVTYGDYVAYKFPVDSDLTLFRKGDHMVKIVLGKPGDQVVVNSQGAIRIVRKGSTVVGNPEEVKETMNFEFLGTPAGTAKPVSKAGKPLKAIESMVIPEGFFYAYAPHPDSLDSRYAFVGLISDDEVIGRTFPIF